MGQEFPKGSDNKPELNSSGTAVKSTDSPVTGKPERLPTPLKRIGLLPKWLVGLVILGAIATGGLSLYILLQSRSLRQQTASPTPAPLETQQRFVTALGRLEPEGEAIELAAPTSLQGERLEQLLVEEGDKVRADRVIAIMDSRERLAAELEQAKEQVKIAQARLEQVRAGAKTGDIAAQEAAIARLQAQLPRDIAVQEATIARLNAEVEGDIAAQEATVARLEAQVFGDRAAQEATINRLGAELQEQIKAQKATLNRIQAEIEGQKAVQEATINRLQAQLQGDTEAQQATIQRLQAQLQGDEKAQQATIERLQAQRQGDTEAQQATLDRLQAEVEKKIEAQNATITRLQAELENAGAEYRRYEQLYRDGAISESLFDSKRLEVEKVLQALKEAYAILDEIEATGGKQLEEAQVTLTKIERTADKQIQEAQATLTKIERTGGKQIQEAQVTLTKIERTGGEEIQEARANLLRILATGREQLEEARANLNRIEATGREQLKEELATLNKIQGTGREEIQEAQVKREQREGTGREQLNEASVTRDRIQVTGEQELNAAKSTLESIAEVRNVDVIAAKAEVDSAIAQVKQVQARLDEAFVRSPIDGQVMKIHTRPGEMVSDRGIVEIGKTEQMYAISEVYETDIMQVRLGQRATITSGAFEGELHGTVDRIGLQIGKKDVLDTDPAADIDVRVVEVKIRLDSEDSQRVSGLTNLQVEVAIATVAPKSLPNPSSPPEKDSPADDSPSPVDEESVLNKE